MKSSSLLAPALLFALLLGAPARTAAQQPNRPAAIEHSDAYYTRLTIHRVGSYAMLPLFGAEYLLGRKLEQGGNAAGWVKPTHVGVAVGISALFAVNTVTGAMNLWEARQDEQGRTRRWVHAGLMTLADAGFAVTALNAQGARRFRRNGVPTGNTSNFHRDAALVSFGLSTAGTLFMLFGDGH